MDQIFLQILNGLDKGSAYALIALGLTLIFGTLGVVNFAHGALFMLGAFCTVALNALLKTGFVPEGATASTVGGFSFGGPKEVLYTAHWFGEEAAATIADWSVPISILIAVPIMMVVGIVMERGLIKHFYKRPHADQILVTFGLAIVLQEIVRIFCSVTAQKAPIMNSAPWAKFTTPSVPKIRVSPRAISA